MYVYILPVRSRKLGATHMTRMYRYILMQQIFIISPLSFFNHNKSKGQKAVVSATSPPRQESRQNAPQLTSFAETQKKKTGCKLIIIHLYTDGLLGCVGVYPHENGGGRGVCVAAYPVVQVQVHNEYFPYFR